MSTYKKAKLLKIKSAISEFLINTQKIVKSVEPSAEIIVLQNPSKRARPANLPKAEKKPKIIIPDYKKIKKSEISDNDSDEFTDDEFYEEAHKSREKLEILLRTCPELCKIKSGITSTFGLHQKGKTLENLNRNLRELEMRIGRKVGKYEEIAVKMMKWPSRDVGNDLVVKFP